MPVTTDQNATDAQRADSTRRMRLVPSVRHGLVSMTGTLDSQDVVRAIAKSAGGWLHVDGTAVSQGSREHSDPLRAVGSVREVVERLSAVRGVTECLRHRLVRQGRDSLPQMEPGPRAAAVGKLVERANEVYPLPDEAGELAALGWYKVEFYLQGDARMIGCVPTGDVPAEIRQGINRLAASYRVATADLDEARPPCTSHAEPDPSDYEGLTGDDFVRFPDFADYDAETRTVSFHGTEFRLTLPGGPDRTPDEEHAGPVPGR